MIVDLTSAATALLGLASAAASAAIPIVVPAVLKRLHVANDADLVAKIDMACLAGAGAAYKFAVAHEGGLANVAVHDGALAVGVQHVALSMPDTLIKVGRFWRKPVAITKH